MNEPSKSIRVRASRVALAALMCALVLGGAVTTGARTVGASTMPWMNTSQSASVRATELLNAMSQSDEIALVTGQGTINPALGTIPRLRLDDGPNGVAFGETQVTAFPSAENIAASFDTSLSNQYGTAFGQELSGKGYTQTNAPTVNIARTPYWGREAESFGEDPYLSGQIVAHEIQGIQAQHVIATVKHFAGNNQETNRFGTPFGTGNNDIVSERALQEIYLPAFKAAVTQGGSQSVMCSINSVNGVHTCQSPDLMNTLQNAWGFGGFVIPDTFAVSDPVAAFNVGQVKGITSAQLTAALTAGTITQATLDKAAHQILEAMFAVGLFDYPNTGNSSANVSTVAHQALATQISEEGSVLLKNESHTLPISPSKKSIAVIGDAATPTTGQVEEGGSAFVHASSVITPLSAISTRAGSGVSIHSAPGTLGDVPLADIPSSDLTPSSGTGPGLTGTYFANGDFTGTSKSQVDPTIDFSNGCITIGSACSGSVRWTGTLTAPETGLYRFSLTQGGGVKMFVDGKTIIIGPNGQLAQNEDDAAQAALFGLPGLLGIPTPEQGTIRLVAGQAVPIEVDYSGSGAVQLGWETPSQSNPMIQAAVAAAKSSKIALVFVSQTSSEGYDRANLKLPGDDDRLISAVAAANPNTVVVLNTPGPVHMPWLSNVKSVIESWMPGQQDGQAIAALLFGDANFSGRTPVTWPAAQTQGPGQTAADYPGLDNNETYSEGIFVGYRYYQENKQTPLFPFGYGLSYSKFSAPSDVRVFPNTQGGWTVSAKIRNMSNVAGTDVLQAYVHDPKSTGEPAQQLKAFTRVTLAPGASTTIHLNLPIDSFSYFDSGTSTWTVTPGTYTVSIGTDANSLYPAPSFRIAESVLRNRGG